MLSITHQGPIARLRMSQGKVNAMDLEFCREMTATLDRLSKDCDAVLLEGNSRAFSAGVDLKRLIGESPNYIVPFLEALDDTMRAIFCFPRPIIAVIEGAAIAGGCMMACACDYRLIAPTAKIGIPELRIGVPLPMTAIEIVRSIVLPQAFQRIVEIGATFIGSEAVAVGLADEVVDVGSLVHRATEVALEYTSIPRQTFELTKRQLRAPAIRQIEANRREFAERFFGLWTSPETRQAIEKYVHERLGHQA